MLFISFAILPFVSKAQPSNDDICSAVILTIDPNNCTVGNITNATTIPTDIVGSCWVGGTKSHTVWYYFIAPADGNVTVSLDNSGGSLTDSQVAVFSSSDNTCSGTLTEVACDDDGGSSCNLCASVTITGLAAGNTYFIEVDGYGSITGTFCIDINNGNSILTNDDCADAMNLWVGASCNYHQFSTFTNYPTPITSATSESWETVPACWSQGTTLNTVWFSFTALDASTIIKVEATNPGTDPHVAIYSGSCGSLTLVDCQEDKSAGGPPANRGVDLTFSTTAGQKYYIQYDSDQAPGSNNICLTSSSGLTTPGNDVCSGSTSLLLNDEIDGNNWLATPDGSITCESAENTVWYKFAATNSSLHYFSVTDQSGCMLNNNTSSTHTNFYEANLQLALYNIGSCTPSSGDVLSCASYYNRNDIEISATLTSGNDYLLAVDGFGGSSCGFKIKVSDTPILPVNLISFYGEIYGDASVVFWATVSELNNNYFVIERSSDAVDFQEIGKVFGAGNSNVENNYRFIDYKPLEGISFYQLKQVDYDGTIDYPGKVITITHQGFKMDQLIIHPNPISNDKVAIQLNDIEGKNILVTVTNPLGEQIVYSKITLSKNMAGEKINIPLSDASPGIYHVSVQSGQQNLFKRIVIN